jgi:hypothetical protein
MSYFIRNANMFTIASEEALDIQKVLPVGNYTVKQNPMSGQFFLEMVDSFEPMKKLYGNTTKNSDRILRTFMDRPNSTGVMLTGEKGSGKSLLAKTISIDAANQGIPTLIINTPFTGDNFNKFMQDIEQPCVILFDEFEKVYTEQDQEAALTLMDGVFPSRKLFVLTCNDKWRINQHMRNRPGRIYYMIEFAGLDTQFIREYCQDVLIAKNHIDKVCEIAALFEQFNFDMLKALVEEMNRYNETPQDAISMLNAKPEYNNKGTFDVNLVVSGREIPMEELETKAWHGNPLVGNIHVEYDTDPNGLVEDDTVNTWFTKVFTPNDLKKVAAEKGIFTYTNAAGDVLLLSRQKQQTQFNYLAL